MYKVATAHTGSTAHCRRRPCSPRENPPSQFPKRRKEEGRYKGVIKKNVEEESSAAAPPFQASLLFPSSLLSAHPRELGRGGRCC